MLKQAPHREHVQTSTGIALLNARMVSDQLHRPAALPLQNPLQRRLGGPQNRCSSYREKYCPVRVSNFDSLCRPTRTVLTTRSELLFLTKCVCVIGIQKRNIRIGGEKFLFPKSSLHCYKGKSQKFLFILHSRAMHQLTFLLPRTATNDFLRKMCSSDEAIFHVSGVVNTHSCRTRGSENLYAVCDMETVTK